jgi:hypothetical protein
VDFQSRKVELLALKENDSLQVVDLYRRIVGLNRCCMLPGGMDFQSLVESILEHETGANCS